MVIGLIMICGIFLGGWILQAVGLDKGRGQSLTLFVPAAVLIARGIAMNKRGRGYASLIRDGICILFGIAILVSG